MSIEQAPYRQYRDRDEAGGDKEDTFNVRVNREERARLEIGKKVLEQERDSTALKQLAEVGLVVLQDPHMRAVLAIIFKNKRNNKRQGIVTYDPLG